MRIAVCPFCGVMHEAVGREDLNGADEQRRYRLTHCRLCETPSKWFKLLAREEPDLKPGDFGYPSIVMTRFDEGRDTEREVDIDSVQSERRFGALRGQVQVPNDFNQPVPDDGVCAFEGAEPDAVPPREGEAAFLARGLHVLERAWRTGKYVEASAMLRRLERQLANARARGPGKAS